MQPAIYRVNRNATLEAILGQHHEQAVTTFNEQMAGIEIADV